jgi:hypothetical protein
MRGMGRRVDAQLRRRQILSPFRLWTQANEGRENQVFEGD